MDVHEITVKELFYSCKDAIERGYGDRKILISDDDEGNGFHTMYYTIDYSAEGIKMALELEHDRHTADEVVVLG